MKKENRFFNILLKRILVFLLVIVTVITSFNTFKTTYASTNTFPYDASPILEDLQSTREFNLSDYTASTTKTPAIVNFVEWCYSVKNPNDFALYIYFYNPQQWAISENSEGNLVTMAVSYNSEGAPADYESFKLVFCNKSDSNLLYKFRIEDHESADRNNIQSRVNSELRRYDISAITFDITNVGAKTVSIGGCFKFSGFAKGYGDSDVSTLKSEGVTNTETLRLVVNPTVYRTAGSELGGNHQVDVNSVYFSVPEKYFTEYGNLQKIKAEWWEYKLKPTITFDGQGHYDTVSPFFGRDIGFHTDELDIGYYGNKEIYAAGIIDNVIRYNGPLYNINEALHHPDATPISALYLGFVSENGYVSREQVESAVKGYDKTYNSGALELGGYKYSLDIFEDFVDEGRTQGYNLKEIDADDKFNLLNYYDEDDHTDGFKRFWANLWNLHDYTDRNDVTPIESNITDITMSQKAEQISKELLINEDDVDDFKAFYNTAKKNGERTVLFRFAQTDYESTKVSCTDCGSDAWISTETLFLNFRIIQLTFSKLGKSMVIPVAQDPIDIMNGLTTHPDDDSIFEGVFDESNILIIILKIIACIFICLFLVVVTIFPIWLIVALWRSEWHLAVKIILNILIVVAVIFLYYVFGHLLYNFIIDLSGVL